MAKSPNVAQCIDGRSRPIQLRPIALFDRARRKSALWEAQFRVNKQADHEAPMAPQSPATVPTR